MTTSPRRTRAVVALASMVAIASVSATVEHGTASALDVPTPSITGFHDGVYVPIDALLLGEQSDASVVANGNLALTWAGSTFAGTVDEADQLDSFDSDVGLRGAITLELAAEAGGDVRGTLELITVPLTAFEVGPAVVTPYLGVDVRFGGHAEAGAQVSVVAPFDVGAAFSFDGAAHASSTTRPRFQPQIGLPDAANALAFDVTVEAELTMTFMVMIEGIFPVGGPVLAASLGAELDVDLLDDPWWRLDALTGLKYGWSMPDLTGAPEPPNSLHPLFPPRRRTIAQAHDAGPLGDVSTRWSRAFDIFNDDDGGAVLPVGDELLVTENDNNPWLTTLDGVGNPTWQQTDSQSSGSQAVARTDTGSLLVAGERGSDLRIGRYAADGTPEWSKDVHVTEATVADWSAIAPTADGAIIAGKVRRGTTAVERPTLVALDDAGDLQWATAIDPGPGSGDATIVEVVETPSGELLAVGDIAYELPDRSIDQWNVLIMRLDPNTGTPLASYVLGGPYSDRATGVAVQPDGSYAISGQSTVTPGTNDSWVASFDADDDLRWSSTYADRLDAGYDTATGIATVAGGDYVVSGTNGMVAKDGWMIRIDGSGMPMWSKSYVGADEDELVGVVAMPVGVAAFGRTNTTNPLNNSFDDLWIVRTNIDGMVHFGAGSGFDTINGAVQWNPTSIHVQLQLAPATVPTTATVTDAPIAVTAANATNSLLTD